MKNGVCRVVQRPRFRGQSWRSKPKSPGSQTQGVKASRGQLSHLSHPSHLVPPKKGVCPTSQVIAVPGCPTVSTCSPTLSHLFFFAWARRAADSTEREREAGGRAGNVRLKHAKTHSVRLFETFLFFQPGVLHLISLNFTYCRILGYFFILTRRTRFARTTPGRAAPHYAHARILKTAGINPGYFAKRAAPGASALQPVGNPGQWQDAPPGVDFQLASRRCFCSPEWRRFELLEHRPDIPFSSQSHQASILRP
jgi:hypothetical protein